ncbi:MAG: hypothetical protein ABEJ66_03765 [Candidatus Nanohaloarchaea archaeon]
MTGDERKGLADSTMGPILSIVLLVAFMMLVFVVVKPLILNAAESQEGCSFLASVLSDISSGLIEAC